MIWAKGLAHGEEGRDKGREMAEHDDIDPTSFDVIVLGTGLPECILAAAAATAGKSVLHVDYCDFYGSFYSSLPLHQFTSWISNSCRFPDLGKSSSHDKTIKTEVEELGLKAINLGHDSSPYFGISLAQYDESLLREESGAYNIDLAGPKLLLCGEPFVDLLLRSKTNNYLEFKGIEAIYIRRGGELVAVPSSRADVFKDRSLNLREKRFLMRFFKLVTEFGSSECPELSEVDLESPFVDLLRRQELPASMQAMILYAIALADIDQDEKFKDSFGCLTSKAGLERLALYLSSVGRFSNAHGAFLYPLYGQGELAQAFCRSAAVKGALYVLRRNVDAILVEKESLYYKGIRTGSGQILYSHKLVVGPSIASLKSCFDQEHLGNKGHDFAFNGPDESSSSLEGSGSKGKDGDSWKVARFVCVTDSSLQPDQHNILIIFPPYSSLGTFSSVIRALQLGSNTSVCPKGRFLVQFSTLCLDHEQAREAIQSILEAFFQVENNASQGTSKEQDDDSSGVSQRPKILWSSFYVQSLEKSEEMQFVQDGVVRSALPDQTLNYQSILKYTEKIFHELFGDLQWFPNTEAKDLNDHETIEYEDLNEMATPDSTGAFASTDAIKNGSETGQEHL